MLFNSSVKVDDRLACGLDFDTQCCIVNADEDGDTKETNESVSGMFSGTPRKKVPQKNSSRGIFLL